MEKNLKFTKKYTIKLYFNNKVDEIIIPNDATVPEIRKIIYDKYLLSHFNYSILYRNKKLTVNDLNKASYYFDKDSNPFLFIIHNKLNALDCNESPSVFLTTNMNEKQVNELLSKFFEIKSLPFNVNIKLLMKNKYRIRFTRPLHANEFIQYYNIINYKNTNNTIEVGLRLPKMKFKKSISSGIIDKNNRENSLDKVIKQNNKDSLISNRTMNSGLDIYHPLYLKDMKTIQSIKHRKNRIKLVKNNYKGIFKIPFLNPDEKYYREKFLDKKKWIDKKGFIVSVGNYKMGGGKNFIPNYVSATPSESPLNYNFREVNKSKWVNKKGFFL